jgi:hypothetical protein
VPGDVVAVVAGEVEERSQWSAVQTFISGDRAAAADGGTAPSQGFDGSSRQPTASDIALRMIE